MVVMAQSRLSFMLLRPSICYFLDPSLMYGLSGEGDTPHSCRRPVIWWVVYAYFVWLVSTKILLFIYRDSTALKSLSVFNIYLTLTTASCGCLYQKLVCSPKALGVDADWTFSFPPIVSVSFEVSSKISNRVSWIKMFPHRAFFWFQWWSLCIVPTLTVPQREVDVSPQS
jgi:hypothetical protein